MRSFIYRTFIALLTFLFACSAAAQASGEISLNGEWWSPRLSGEIGGVQPKSELGLDKSSVGSINLSIKGEHGPRYFLKYDGPNFSNNSTLDRPLSFGGITHNVNDRIASELKVKHLQFGIKDEKTIASGKLSLIYSYHHNEIETIIENNSNKTRSSQNDKGDALSFGLSWETTHPNGLNYFAEATPLSIGHNAHYQDYNIGIKSKLGTDLVLTTGYRGEKISAGQTSYSIGSRLHLRGWYIFIAAEK